jgi:hypothetical protein
MDHDDRAKVIKQVQANFSSLIVFLLLTNAYLLSLV